MNSDVDDSIADFGLRGFRKCVKARGSMASPMVVMVERKRLLTRESDTRLLDVAPKNPRMLQKRSGANSPNDVLVSRTSFSSCEANHFRVHNFLGVGNSD
jgi:hypothetical protein